MSAYTSGKKPISELSATGRSNPARAIMDINPMVFKVTVLPPVLGPEIMMTRVAASHWISLGITSCPFRTSSGLRARRRFARPSFLSKNRRASILPANRARA